MSLHIQESYVNATKGHRFGESEIYDTGKETPGELYRACMKEYGRCASKVYVDTASGPRPIGWVFVSRQRYDDARDNRPESYYVRETWITVHKAPATVTKKEHLRYLDEPRRQKFVRRLSCRCAKRKDDDGRPMQPDTVTCGACGFKWCDRCNPTHGPRCWNEVNHVD